MAPSSMDLRSRVLREVDAGLSSNEVAAKYYVSRAWVDRGKQRRRAHGEIAPRRQTVFRRRVLTPRDETRLVALITAHPEATLVELRAALPTTAALSTLWRAQAPGVYRLKNGTRRRATPAGRGRGSAAVAGPATSVGRPPVSLCR